MIQEIEKQLESGLSGKEVISKYIPSHLIGYFKGYITYLPLGETMEAIVSLAIQKREKKEQLIKGLLYPCIMFVGVNIGIFLFESMVIPSMLSLLSSFHANNQAVFLVQDIVLFLSKLILLFTIVICIILTIALDKQHIVKTNHRMHQYLPHGLLEQHASETFSYFYLACLQRGISTKESLQILMNLEEEPLVNDIAKQLNNMLVQGYSFEQALRSSYIEPILLRIFQIGMYSSNCIQLIQGYQKMVAQRTKRQIKRFTIIVQCEVYCLIGIVLILVYQVLLMPLDMMQML